jgi:outer membrane protein assembly factor BamB
MNAMAKLVSVIVLLVAATTFAADWSQYLGPTRDGISPQKNLLRTWPTEGPKVEWTANVGAGYGGAVVCAGKVYLLDRDDNTGDILRCLDLSSGKELWNFPFGSPGRIDHPGSRSLPTVDGNNIYACGAHGDFYCISTSTHKPIWQKNIWKDFGGSDVPRWAITQNPLIYKDLVIIASQAPQAGVVAYDKLKGDVKWKTPPLGGAGYVSPAIVKVAGQDHIVMIVAGGGRGGRGGGGDASSSGSGIVNGINPSDGKVLWTYSNWSCMIPIPSAVDAGEGRVLVTGGYSAGAAMIKVEKKADGSFGATELFKNAEFCVHTQPPILYKGNFYGQCTTNERSDGLVCMSIDGQIKWKTLRAPAFSKGGMILADDLLLAVDGETKLYLIEPDSTAFKPLASAVMLTQGENWAPIALVDGKLLIRDQKQLKCLTVAK